MNKITQTLQAGREALDERMKLYDSGFILEQNHKDWFTTYQHTLLDAIAEEVEKMEAPLKSDYDLEAVHDGYFAALDDVLTLLSEAKQQDV